MDVQKTAPDNHQCTLLSDTNEMFARIVLTVSHIANEQMSDD